MWPADLITLTEEILNGKLHFCAVLSLGSNYSGSTNSNYGGDYVLTESFKII